MSRQQSRRDDRTDSQRHSGSRLALFPLRQAEGRGDPQSDMFPYPLSPFSFPF